VTLALHPVEVLLSLLLGLCFALTGDLLVGRRSHGVFQWNESFLLGCGVSAAALFPLSVLLPHAALTALACGLLAVGASQALARRVRGRPSRPSGPSPGTLSRMLGADLANRSGWVFLVLVVAAWGCFALLDLRGLLGWDGFQIWATKAMVLVHKGALTPELWDGGERYGRIGRIAKYPQLVPMVEALLSRARGGFDFEAVKPIFLLFYTSLLISTYRAASRLVSPTVRLAAPALVALLPLVSTGAVTGGYADMPLAAYVAGVIASLLTAEESRRGWRSPAPWLIGFLTLVKSEGIVLAVVVCAALLVHALAGSGRTFVVSLRARLQEIAVVVALLGLRAAYLAWAHVPDPEFSIFGVGTLARAITRVPVVAKLTLVEMFHVRTWGLLWPAALVGGAAVVAAGTRAARTLLLGTGLAVAAYSAVFLWTNWNLELHFDNAYPRLASQLAPAVVLTVLCGFEALMRRYRSAAGGAGPGRSHGAPE
jgi:hypothetical protein